MTAKNIFVATVVAAAALIAMVALGNYADIIAAQDKKPDLTDAKFYGVSTCNKCHADSPDGKPGKWATDFVLMNEFTTWRTQDRHALAYAVLDGPRGQQIGKLLNIDVTKEAQCLNCHATTSRPERKGKMFNNHDGVSCDGCHGPAQHWIIDHALEPDTWRLKTPEEKEDLGMYDMRNPVKRTQLCMSCHVGNTAEGKVVTHAMYAAGHPPLLSFEAANFARNLPPHWRDAKDVEFFKKTDEKVRKQNYADDAEFQQTKLVLATCREALRSMMELIANRAAFDGTLPEKRHAWPPPWLRPYAKNTPLDRWPELPAGTKEPKTEELQNLWPEIAMAQSDCFACHHDLKSNSWRQLRGYAGRPGRPQFQPWPFALAPLALLEENDFAARRKKLSLTLDAQPFGIPKDVPAAALDLAAACEKMLDPTAPMNRESAEKLLKALLTHGAAGLKDYDSARQIAWATRIVYAEWKRDHPEEKAIAKILADMDNDLNLTLDSQARREFVKERRDLTKALATLDTKAFAAKVQDKAFLGALQKISNDELASALARVNDYDPASFQRRMEALRELLGLK